MPCLRPVPALQYPSGKVTIKHRRHSDVAVPGEIELPCGRCASCRTVRIRNWAIRGYHESLTNKRKTRWGSVPNGCFITLTYDQDHVPADYSLKLSDWQNFMKKLRRTFPQKIRYLACGEYGPLTGRPHLHACLYGVDFHEDRTPCKHSTAQPDSVEWISPTLNYVWGKGLATLGSLSYATASYTAGYVLKKLSSDEHAETALYGATNEPLELRKQEFNTMSKKPGLGRDWFERYWPDVYPKDSVEIEGKSFRPPPYYDQLLKASQPVLYDEVLESRQKHVQDRGLTSELELLARGAIFSARIRDNHPRGDL